MSKFLVRTNTILWLVATTGASFLILIGGMPRWSSVSYQYINAIPGGSYTWGWSLLVMSLGSWLGLALREKSVAAQNLLKIAMTGLALWLFVMASCALFAAILNPSATWTGPWWLSFIAANIISLVASWASFDKLQARSRHEVR